MGALVTLRTPEGKVTQVDESEVGAFESAGFTRESTGQQAARVSEQAAEEQFGGAGSAIEAGAYGLARGATLGLSDVILRAGGADAKALSGLRSQNKGVSLATEILGGVVPSIASGGTGTVGSLARLTPSGALSRGAATLGERTAAGAIGRATVSGAVEGGVQNVGMYLSDVALGNKDLSAEGVVGSMGQGALFGGGAGGLLAGAERGTIAARRMFPKLAGGGKEAAQIAEETFHAGADDMLKKGDDLERVARSTLDDLNIRQKELQLERLKLKGSADPNAPVRRAEIAVEQARITAERKALRAAKNAERAAQGLPDIPPEVPEAGGPIAAPEPTPVANDVAPIEPANANLPGAVAPALHGSDDLMARLGATKQALDEGIPFTEIGRAENDLTVAAGNASHEAATLADSAVDDGIAHVERLAQKTEDFAAAGKRAREYAAALKAKAKNPNREISYRPLQEGSDVLGVSASKRSGKVVTPTGEQEIRARAGDQVFAGVGDVPAAPIPESVPSAPPSKHYDIVADTPEKAQELEGFERNFRQITGKGDASASDVADMFAPPPGFKTKPSFSSEEFSDGSSAVFSADIVKESGEKVGSVIRKFSRDEAGNLVVRHDQIKVFPGARGGGISDTINASALDAYERLGVNRITMDADQVGRYHWNKAGFKIEPDIGLAGEFALWARKKPALKQAAIQLKKEIDAIRTARPYRELSDAQKYQALLDSSSNPILKELDGTLREPGALAAHSFSEGATGKDFLLYGSSGKADSDWVPSDWLIKMSVDVKPGDPWYDKVRSSFRAGNKRPRAEGIPDGFDVDAVVDGDRLFDGTPAVHKGVPTWDEAGGMEKLGYRERVYVVRPSELAERPLYGTSWHKGRSESVRKAWDEGKRLAPIEVDITPSGKLSVQDGNHRLQAAAIDDRPIAVRFRPAASEYAVEYADDIAARVAGALPDSAKSGRHLDVAYETALGEAAKAATDDAQESALRRAAALEDRIMAAVERRGGRDAEYVAAIRKAREDVGWDSYKVAVRRVEKRVTGEPLTTGRANADEAFDAAIRRSEAGMGETVGQRADAMMADLGSDIPGPFRYQGDRIGPKGSLADEILRGQVDRADDIFADVAAQQPSQGRLIDSAEEGIKVFDDYERAHHALVEELGAAAPPAAQMHAQQYAAAIEDQARKQAESFAMNADKAAATVGLGAPPNVQRLPKLPAGAAKRAADLYATLELVQSVGDIPFMPDVKNLPVIGPILSMYLKFRGARAVFNRFGGRIAATAESKAAVRAAELRDRAAGIVDEILEGTGKAAGYASKRAGAVAPKAAEVLRHSLYPDGEKRDEPKNAAEATKHRVAELSRAVANPDAVKRAVQAQFAASDPDLVNAVANATLRKLQYLQKHAPKEPPPGPLGSKPWHPSAAEVERFARRVRAAEDPTSVLRDVERGTITPEAAETLRVVYPQIFAEVQTRLITRAAELRAELPRQRILQLSLLFDAPLDPSLEPANLAILQATHAPTATGQAAGQNAGQPPAPSVANPVNVSRLYSDQRRAGP